MQVEIISIGDEILIGQIINTNSAWMAKELTKHNMQVSRITTVSDDEQQIINAIQAAFRQADAILITGGIGPTKDDVTKNTLCSYFNTKLVFDEAVYRNIEELFANRPNVINELTRNQAYVPQSATIIQNKLGTAPLTWFEKDGKVLVSMPGVPYEMEHAMSTEIIPRLASTFRTLPSIHTNLLVVGYPESQLAITIGDWENSLPSYMRLAYLPSPGMVKLRISASSNTDAKLLQKEIDAKVNELHHILGEAIIANQDIRLEELLGKILKNKKLTLATAESCTGGNIASKITSVAGSSSYFKGSVVAYQNEVKQQLLHVSGDDLAKYGAVSQQVVEQMAEGALSLFQTDVAIATSGIAGPDGGTVEKPVGTVWIAVCLKGKTQSSKFQFRSNSRERIIEMSTLNAFVMLKRMLDME